MYHSNDFSYVDEDFGMYYHICVESISHEFCDYLIRTQVHGVPYYHWTVKDDGKLVTIIIPNLGNKNAIKTLVDNVKDAYSYDVYCSVGVVKTHQDFNARFINKNNEQAKNNR